MFATEGAHTLWSSSQTAAEELEAPILSALLLLNTLGFMCAEQRVEIPPIRQTTVMWKGFGSQVSKQSYRCSFVLRVNSPSFRLFVSTSLKVTCFSSVSQVCLLQPLWSSDPTELSCLKLSLSPWAVRCWTSLLDGDWDGKQWEKRRQTVQMVGDQKPDPHAVPAT